MAKTTPKTPRPPTMTDGRVEAPACRPTAMPAVTPASSEREHLRRAALAARCPSVQRPISAGRDRLHDAVADHPERRGSCRPAVKLQPEVARQEDRHADDEPDVARAEQEEPRGRRGRSPRGSSRSMPLELRLRLRPCPAPAAATAPSRRAATAAAPPAIAEQGGAGSRAPRAAPAEEEADALERVLRARQQRHPLEERADPRPRGRAA